MAENKRIPELPGPHNSFQGTDAFVIYDRVNGVTKYVPVSNFTPSANTQDYEWQNSPTSYDEDEVVTFGGKWWQSLENANEGNIPAENTHWTELSKSASGFVLWAAGLFTEDEVFVLNTIAGSTDNIQLYRLLPSEPRPFNSTNFATELAAGKWIPEGKIQVERAAIKALGSIAEISDVFTFNCDSAQQVTGFYTDTANHTINLTNIDNLIVLHINALLSNTITIGLTIGGSSANFICAEDELPAGITWDDSSNELTVTGASLTYWEISIHKVNHGSGDIYKIKASGPAV